MRKITLTFLLLFLFLLPVSPIAAAEEPEVGADAALLYDMDAHAVLWQKEGNKKMAPASLIKVLNLLTAEPYLSLAEEVAITPLTETVYNGQILGLKAGDVIRAEDLICGMMLFSANDAAVAVAGHLIGDVDFFAQLMDVKAWALGAGNTVSVNVNGYSEGNQGTTCYDLAVLATAFMDNDRLLPFASKTDYEVTWLNPEKKRPLTNINKFLYSYEGATGLKTGTTAMAGKCLIATAEKNGKRLLAVALSSSDRYGDCIKMMDYGYRESGALAAEIIDDME